MTNITVIPLKSQRDYWERLLAGFAIAAIIIAWIVGGIINQTDPPDCRTVLPEAQLCKPVSSGIIEGVIPGDTGSETVVGWAKTSEASGYAGPITMLVGISPSGEVLGVSVLEHTETPGFFSLIENAGFVEGLAGSQANSPFRVGQDVDAVSRATVSALAISEAVREASYTIAETKVGLEVAREVEPIKFGLPEFSIIALYAVGWVAHRGGFKYKKIARWGTMLTGLVILGFIYSSPLTIAHINSLLLGFWPSWRANLYWFLLVGGILFISMADGKNPYCSWFCPFGAAQECLGAIGGAKLLHPGRYRSLFIWLQRGLAWSAVVIALLMRNPGFSSYEIFGTLFSFNGIGVQWIILIIILLLSLFVKRPWCNFLCPLDPIEEFIAAQRRWIRQVYKQWRTQRNAARS